MRTRQHRCAPDIAAPARYSASDATSDRSQPTWLRRASAEHQRIETYCKAKHMSSPLGTRTLLRAHRQLHFRRYLELLCVKEPLRNAAEQMIGQEDNENKNKTFKKTGGARAP